MVRVPATTANLGPGFDCLGMAVSIFNTMELIRDGGGPLLEIGGSAATPDIPADETNLVYRAAGRIFALVGQSIEGVRLKLSLESPLARGLGSSASAIAGGMFVANEFLGRPLSQDDLVREATDMEGHPDNVVPCLVGGLTVSLCLEDRVIYEKIQPARNLRCVFFIPDYELETSVARGVMPKSVSMQDAVFNSARVPFVLSKLRDGLLDDLGVIVEDRLHQPYRIPLIKGYEAVRHSALEAGAAAVCISGAGPTILAICDGANADAVKEAGHEALVRSGVNPDSRVVMPDADGCFAE